MRFSGISYGNITSYELFNSRNPIYLIRTIITVFIYTVNLNLVGAGNFEIPTNWVRTSYSASELRSHSIAVIYLPTARGYLQIADKFWYLFHVGPC